MKLFVASLNAYPTAEKAVTLKLTEGSVRDTYVSTDFLGKELQQTIEAFNPRLPVNPEYPNVLDFNRVYLDGTLIKEGGEDAAPYRIFGTTIGGNHGYFRKFCTATHDKAWVDVGSIWNDGTDDRVLYAITDSDQLVFDGGTLSAPVTLTHVSGATNTSDISVTYVASDQWYPVTSGYSLSLFVDGQEKELKTSQYTAGEVMFDEEYYILQSADIRDWLVANVGTLNGPSETVGLPSVYVSNKVRYTKFANTIEGYFEVMADGFGAAFQDIMFVMGFNLVASASYPNLKAYIPKALPYTDETGSWDWANIESLTGKLPLSTRSNITPGRAEATGIFCDRHIYLLDGVGFAMGFLPIYDADPSVRRTRANNKAMQLATSGKVYMSAIDDNGVSTMIDGQNYKVVSYKVFFETSDNRTAYYTIDSPDGDYYVYADWHTVGQIDVLPINPELWGKNINIVEASSNVSITDTVFSNTLEVEISGDESYGYLILKTS